MTLQSFERAPTQPKPSSPAWVALFSLFSLMMLSGQASAAPATVEIFAGSGGTAAGPVSSTEAYQYRLNANNPTDNVNAAYTPTVSVSYAITNSVYNVSTYQGGATNQPNLFFGGTFGPTKVVNGNPVQTNIIAPSQINVPLNTVGAAPNNVFAATVQNGTTCPATGACTSTNGGINSTNTASPQNHGTRMSIAIRGFDAAGLSTNNVRHRVGQVTVTFNRPVTNPVLQLAGLGGTSAANGGNNLGFSGEFTLVGNTTSDNNNNIVLSRIAGSTELSVQGNNIVNRATTITATTGSGGASGSVLINGRRITSLTFDVFMRGDNGNAEWTSDGSADPELRGAGLETLFFGVSSVEADSDLSIAKTQRIGTSGAFVATQILPNQLDIIQYQIVMSNGTTNALVNASFSDIVPSNITGLSIVSTTTTGTGATCPNALTGNTLTGTFSGPASATCTITLQGTASTVGSITNSATILENATDPNTANNSSSVNAIIAPSADLSVTKTNGVSNVSPAGTTAYTVVVSNAGPSAANNATFQDAAATGLSKTSITCTASGGAVCPTAPIDLAVVEGASGIAIPTLPSGGSVTFTVNANVTVSGGNVTNTATVTAPAGVNELNTANNSASDTDTVSVIIDPNGSATDQCSAANAVNVITPTQDARFENATTITNTIPVSATNSAQTYFGTGPDGRLQVVAQLGWSQGNPQGSRTSSTLSIEVNGTRYALLTTRPAGQPTNSFNGTITAANGATVSINGGAFANSVTIVGGNSGTAGSSLRNVVINLPISVSAATSFQSVFVGGSGAAADDIAYNYQTINQCKNRITLVKALGNNRLSNTDQFVMSVAGQNGPATTTTTGTAATVTNGSVTLFKVRGSTAYTLSELMAAGSASTLSNYSTTYTCTNSSTGTTTVLPAANTTGQSFALTPQAGDEITCTMTNRLTADLQVTKTNNLVNVTSGGTTAYTIVVTNAGPGPANGALFRDVAVAGLSKTSITCTATSGAVCPTAPISIATVEGATGIAIPTLPSGGVATFVVNASVTALSGTVSNTATVTAPAGVTEVNAANNTATDTDTVLTPVVPDTAINEARFTIVPDLPTIFRGGTGTQLVTITNNGPSGATGTIATFIPAPQTGVSVTGVSVVSGAACTFASGEWSCPVGSVANGASFQLNVSYSTAAGAALNIAQQATIKVRSNEFNPGSGVGETLYKVWGTNQADEERPNGAFWVGYTGTGGSTQVGANSDENTPILNAWPVGQASPTGAYLTQAATGVQNSVYGASSTTASPVIQRVVTNMSTDVDRTVSLPVISLSAAGDNRRAWEYRTGVYVPTAQSVQLCIGNTSVGIDDNAYIIVDGTVVAVQDFFSPTGVVSASVALSAGYHQITYRIVNQNTFGNPITDPAAAEGGPGNYGPIGVSLGGACNTANFDTLTNTAVPASINIIDAADLQITKTNNVTAVDAAGTTSYAVVVTNAGPSAANGALFRDIAAAGLSKTTITCTATGGAVCPTAPINVATVEGATGIAIPTLPSGSSVTFTVNANVTATGGSVANTATVTAPAGTTEIDTANNTATDTDTVTPRVNLSISKTNNVTTVDAGLTTAYTVEVSNAGPSSANDALFRDIAAAGLSKTTITCTATGGAVCPTAPISVATVEGATGIAIPTLPSGGSVTFTVNANVTANSGSVANTATVTAPAGTTEIDPDNNTATDTDTVNPRANLSVTKTNGVTAVNAGSTAAYTVVVSNAGPSVADGALFQDAAATGLTKTGISCTAAGGAVCPTSPTVAQVEAGLAIPTLPSGGSVTFTVNATVTAISGSVANTATVTAPAGVTEIDTANNTATDTDTVTPAVDLAVVKSQRAGTTGAFQTSTVSVLVLGTVQYQLVFTNNGPSVVTGATLSDNVPTQFNNVSVVSATGANGATACSATNTVNSVSGTWSGPSGATCTVVVQARAGLTTGNYTNTATTTVPNGTVETNNANNSSSVQTAIAPAADLAIVKSQRIGTTGAFVRTALSVNQLQVVQYQLVLTNNGPTTATAATYTDTIPANITGLTVVGAPTTTGIGTVCAAPTFTGQTLNGTFTAAQDGTCTVIVQGTATTTGSITNTATVTAVGVTDTVTANNSSSVDMTIALAADLSITKTNSVTAVDAGGTTAYTVVVSNAGPSSANNAVFQDAAATGLTKTGISCTAAGGAVCPTSPTVAQVEAGLAIPTLPSGGSVTFTVNANVTATSGSVVNTATVTAPAGTTEINTANNTATDTDTVTPNADLSISKTNSVSSVNAGGSTSYSVVVSNAGPSSANNSVFQDAAATGLTKTSISCTAAGGAVCPTSPTVAQVEAGLAIPTLPSGGSVTFTVNANVTATSGSVTNTATVTAPAGTTEINNANNTATDTDTVNPLISISGRVFTDNSGTTAVAANAYNGLQNTGELGIAGSTVQLNNCAGTVIATTQTDGAGDYSFGVLLTQLSTPNFCITQTNLAGYTSVSGTAGYTRGTDTISIANSGALSYSNHNFGDARLNLVLTSDGQQTTTPSGTVSYPHILRSESVLSVGTLNTISTESPTFGWTTVLYRDTNCNGTVDGGESTLTSAIGQLLPNQEICVVQRVNAPANATNGAQHVATLSASYTATVQGGAVLNGSSNTRTDTTLVGTAGLDMRKQVRVVASCPSTGADNAAFVERNTAQNGDFLEYQIIYSNRSTRNLSQLTVRDVVPSSTTFQSATCQSTPSGSGCTAPVSVAANGDLAWSLTNIAPAATGSVRFCVRVPPLAEPPIR